MADRDRIVADRLLALGKTIDRSNFFPTVVPEASAFALASPFAFLIACCFDRGTKTEVIWTIPHDLHQSLGHLDPARIAAMQTTVLAEVFRSLPHKPRYVHSAPRTLQELAELVLREAQGDAARLWQRNSAGRLQELLDGIHGVGQGIAAMTPLLIEKAFNVRFPDLDHEDMDIKPDTHTKRVLCRLGFAGSEDDAPAVEAARRLNPRYPGELDAPLWTVGRRWCTRSAPSCSDCPLADQCPRVGV